MFSLTGMAECGWVASIGPEIAGFTVKCTVYTLLQYNTTVQYITHCQVCTTLQQNTHCQVYSVYSTAIQYIMSSVYCTAVHYRVAEYSTVQGNPVHGTVLDCIVRYIRYRKIRVQCECRVVWIRQWVWHYTRLWLPSLTVGRHTHSYKQMLVLEDTATNIHRCLFWLTQKGHNHKQCCWQTQTQAYTAIAVG